MQSLMSVTNLKMTSLDLAEITGKQHKNIMRDIRKEIESIGEISELIFELVEYTDSKGEKRPCYEFGRKGVMQLALKYDAVTRYRIIEEIEELENKSLPQTFAQSLRLTADQVEIIEAQKQIAAEAKPKVEYVDRILNSEGLLTITQIAKDYGLTENKLNKILAENNIQYKQSNQWLLYKDYASKSYTKSENVEYKGSKGETKTKLNTKWTVKGRLFIHYLLAELDIHPVKQGNDTYDSTTTLGVRNADKIKYDLFENQATSSFAILVSGGRLTEESMEDIISVLESRKGLDNFHKVAVLEAEKWRKIK